MEDEFKLTSLGAVGNERAAELALKLLSWAEKDGTDSLDEVYISGANVVCRGGAVSYAAVGEALEMLAGGGTPHRFAAAAALCRSEKADEPALRRAILALHPRVRRMRALAALLLAVLAALLLTAAWLAAK